MPLQLKDLKVLSISALVVLVDQLSKLVVRMTIQGRDEPIRLLGDYVRLTYVENPGMAFGIRVGGPAFFTVFATLASLVVLVYLFRLRGDRNGARLALALIFGGAIGNLIDRVLYGQVVDFIEIGVPNFHWPVFNVADTAVTVGMILLITIVLLDRPEKHEAIESD